MKLNISGAALLLFVTQTFAADCWGGNANQFEKYDEALRPQLAFAREAIAYNCGDFPNKICINEGPFTVLGNPGRLFHVYGAANHVPNQGTWWDISWQIITQCMYKNPGWGTVSTGGDYNYGWKGTLGFWYVGNAKRSSEERIPNFGNITLVNGETVSEDRYIGINSNRTLIGFDILGNGTHVPFDVIMPKMNGTLA